MLLLKVRLPFYAFYFQLLLLVLNAVKVARTREFPAFEKQNEHLEYLKRFDARFLLRFLSNEGSSFLRRLSSKRCPSFGRAVDLQWEGFSLNFVVPTKANARFFECKHSIGAVARLVSWSNFELTRTRKERS